VAARWTDLLIRSLTFSVMLHLGTSSPCWPTSGATGHAWCRRARRLRERSFGVDPDRRLAWLIAATLPPAVVLGVLLGEFLDTQVRRPLLVAAMLVVGA